MMAKIRYFRSFNLVLNMKKTILYIFAIIGIISLISKMVGFYQTEKLTREYWKNCEKVEIGMTLNEAREIIGDLKYKYWTQHQNSGGIMVSEIQGELKYTLEYPMVFAGSDNMRLEFDPNTLRVTDIFCGE